MCSPGISKKSQTEGDQTIVEQLERGLSVTSNVCICHGGEIPLLSVCLTLLWSVTLSDGPLRSACSAAAVSTPKKKRTNDKIKLQQRLSN